MCSRCSFCQTRSSMKFNRGSFSYTSAGMDSERGIVISQTVIWSMNLAMIAASPVIVPAVTIPSESTDAIGDSFD